MPRYKSELAFVAWGAVAGRSAELAASLGGTAFCFDPPSSAGQRPVVLRYLTNSVRTLWVLTKVRPRLVMVTSPPVPASLVVWVWARTFGASVILDCHPGSFGAQGDRLSARLQRAHRWVTPRVDLAAVAAQKWQEMIHDWGGRAVVLHEAPPDTQPTPPRRHRRLRVLYVGRFARDEPVEEVVAAAASVPEIDLRVTGSPSKCPPEVRGAATANVSFVGFLDREDYAAELEQADVVITLTTEPASVMRAACEAVYAQRPLILSDWPINHELFPDAIHVDHEAGSLASALRRMDASYGAYAARTPAARTDQLRRFDAQRAELLSHLGGDVAEAPTAAPARA